MNVSRGTHLRHPLGFFQISFSRVKQGSKKRRIAVFFGFGVRGIEPRSQDPQPCIINRYTTPRDNYFLLERVLIHFVQAKILFPAKLLNFFLFVPPGTRTHCKLGYLLFLVLGLYFPRSLTSFLNFCEVFPQI